MAESIYKVIELIECNPILEKAAANAVELAKISPRSSRRRGSQTRYSARRQGKSRGLSRAKLNVSFKFEGS